MLILSEYHSEGICFLPSREIKGLRFFTSTLCLYVEYGKIMLKVRRSKHVIERSSLLGNALTLKKMDDIIKPEGGRAYGYKCIKRISRRNSCYF